MISLILGLGNIGQQYRYTRHNIGFEVAVSVAKHLHSKAFPANDLYFLQQAQWKGRTIFLAKPKTFMNRSGQAAQELLKRLELSASELLVLVDDFNLPLGQLRIRADGSDGGHNGLTSLIESLESDAFPRIRLGIGSPQEDKDPAEFVLEPFTNFERPKVDLMVAKAAEAVLFAIDNPLEKVMSEYNSNPAPPELS